MQLLSRDYSVGEICSIMGVSRSGYYKWLNRDPSMRDLTRASLVEVVEEIHGEHRTHGYRWVAAYIRINNGISISDNFVYKCFRYLGIRAETEHRPHYRPRKVRDRYPNLILSTWETVDRPRQVIVSDMTAFRAGWLYFEVTFYFDVFTKEMLTWRLAERRGCREQYTDGLTDVVGLLKGSSDPVVLHTDQGSVYSSMAYNDLIKDTCIVRSMSRAGTPTDNPVNEALNGWIKEELLIDFGLGECRNRDEVQAVLTKYSKFYNRERPSFAIGYDTPERYRERYYSGALEHRDTFSGRVLCSEPKFVRERRAKVQKLREGAKTSTHGNENTPKKGEMTTFENAEAVKTLEMSTFERHVN